MKDVIGPLIAEVTKPLIAKMKLLRESVDDKYSILEDAISTQQQEVVDEIHKLEESLTNQKEKANAELLSRINSNQQMIESVLKRNRSLEKENITLKDRLHRIEMDQLSNNVIITGIAEQTWETYEHTKQCVRDTVVASLGNVNNPTEIEEVRQTGISYCTRIGKQRPNYNRLILVTF